MEEVLQEYERPAGRPTFITVLCILTFIYSGWALINETMKYFTADEQAAVISKVKEKANADMQKNPQANNKGDQFAKKMVNSISAWASDIRKGAICDLAAAILCLSGALMMWKLKRTGFYLYVAGTLVGIISPFVVFGGSNMVAILSSVVIGFVGIIFVILYGVNFRYMK